MNVESAVLDRYSQGAKTRQETLCCPVNYDQTLLKILPQEIIDKDYGCGDPSRYVKPGDVVLDLGSGSGKICYMAAQLVGPEGLVIGVDMNDDMLALARKYQQDMARQLGQDRVRFYKGHIQDLALDLNLADAYLAQHPLHSSADVAKFQAMQQQQKQEQPLIADNSVDLVISNCVLNLVSDAQKRQLVQEIYRVLKPLGRVAISDIVSDEPIPFSLKNDPELWSGCISGAFHEQAFLRSFKEAGFLAISYDKWDRQPWQTVAGIEFRSVTLTAIKGENIACIDRGHALIYRGPYASISDDEGHLFPRGERMAVCERTFNFLTTGPLHNDFIGITPIPLKDPVGWCAPAGTTRSAKETKGATINSPSNACC